MGRAKEIIVKVIPSKIAIPFIKKHHYSGKVVNNSCLHFGAFLDDKLHGVMSYGPRNAESYCIAKSIKLIKKNAPQIKWIVSFADGCSCGDGTIYRASNFVLTDIKPNYNLVLLPNGEKIHKMTLESNPTTPRKELNGRCYYDITGGKFDFKKYVEYVNGEILKGFQLRYVYFIDKKSKDKLTVPIIPFSKIDELGAGMYKGEKVTQEERHIMK